MTVLLLPCTFAIILPCVYFLSMYPSPSNLIASVTHHFVAIVIRPFVWIVSLSLSLPHIHDELLETTSSSEHLFDAMRCNRYAVGFFFASQSLVRTSFGDMSVCVCARGDWIEQNVLALKYIMSHMSGDLWLFD